MALAPIAEHHGEIEVDAHQLICDQRVRLAFASEDPPGRNSKFTNDAAKIVIVGSTWNSRASNHRSSFSVSGRAMLAVRKYVPPAKLLRNSIRNSNSLSARRSGDFSAGDVTSIPPQRESQPK